MDDEGHFTGEPWLDDFGRIPHSMHDEFAAAVIEQDKVVEINIMAMLLTRRYSDSFKRQYLEYIAELQSKGVTLNIGSDCHSAQYDTDLKRAEQMLGSVDIQARDLWRLPPHSQVAGGEHSLPAAGCPEEDRT